MTTHGESTHETQYLNNYGKYDNDHHYKDSSRNAQK